MILAVSPDKWDRLKALCAGEDVEATAIGRFEQTGRLRLSYEGNQVADLDMHFLHDGRPPVVRRAEWRAEGVSPPMVESTHRPESTIRGLTPPARPKDHAETLL